MTALGGIVQQLVPGFLESLERRPIGLYGEWWRIVTALVVQDGGIAGLATNLFFLAVVGAVAEQILSRPRWLLQYFGTGVITELVGYLLQPVGGGNSIAVCGLASAVALVVWRTRTQLPPWGPSMVVMWCGALLGTLWTPLTILGVAGAVIVGRLAQTGKPTGAVMLAAILATAVVLTAALNLHGPALLVGLGFALAGRMDPGQSRHHDGDPRGGAPEGEGHE